MQFDSLFGNVDLAAAVSGLLSNPVVIVAISIVLGSRVAPTLVAFLKRAIGRG